MFDNSELDAGEGAGLVLVTTPSRSEESWLHQALFNEGFQPVFYKWEVGEVSKQDPNCKCLGCVMWKAIDAWHTENGHITVSGKTIYRVPTVIDACCGILGEILAHSEQWDPARGRELQLQAENLLHVMTEHHRASLARERENASVH